MPDYKTDYSKGKNINTLDKGSYVDAGDETPSKQVHITNTDQFNGGLIEGVDYDTIDVTYPLATREIYTYTLLAVTIRIVTVDYISAAKKDILKVVYA